MTIEITPEIINIIRTVIPHPGLTMKELDRAPPTLATIRELEIDGGPARIDIRYSRANYEVDLTAFNGLDDVLMRLHNNNISLKQSGAVKQEYESPLSLGNKKYCYVIIKLVAKNWQFSGAEPPFSIAIEQWDKGLYYEARKVHLGKKLGKDAKQNGCMIAYFIADGAAAYDDAPEGKYSHGFNFHLDFVYKNHKSEDTYMPVLIDPDIRYPGGSGA
jgi:hypothetical protein